MQISNFLNIRTYYTEIASHFKMFFKSLYTKHGESSYSYELLVNHLKVFQAQ